jgi:hypothetical protein
MIAINSNNKVSVSQSADDVAAELRSIVGDCLRTTGASEYPVMLPLVVAHAAEVGATITLDGADGAAECEAMWDAVVEMLRDIGAGAAGVCQLGWTPAAGLQCPGRPSATSRANYQEVIIMVAVDSQGGRIARVGYITRHPSQPPKLNGWVVMPFAAIGGAASPALIKGVYPSSDAVAQAASDELRAEAATERRERWT